MALIDALCNTAPATAADFAKSKNSDSAGEKDCSLLYFLFRGYIIIMRIRWSRYYAERRCSRDRDNSGMQCKKYAQTFLSGCKSNGGYRPVAISCARRLLVRYAFINIDGTAAVICAGYTLFRAARCGNLFKIISRAHMILSLVSQ